MRICLIATEMEGIGNFGGYGSLTRSLAEGLAARGVEVIVTMPRQNGQRPVTTIAGITVLSYPSGIYHGLRDARQFAALYTMINADVYHSEEPSLGTRLAQLGAPGKKHIVTFQDPRTIVDWRKQWGGRLGMLRELRFAIRYRSQVGTAVKRADATFCQAKFIVDKTVKMYGLPARPGFLPNPVQLPAALQPKSTAPTVCFLGRWDTKKRPEFFIALAKQFAHVKFIMCGRRLSNDISEADFRTLCGAVPNLEAPGWVAGDEKRKILGRSWVLVNTSTNECLPVSYLEASACKCAILSHCNADEFASKYGFWARTGDLPDFATGLEYLLTNDRWKTLGEQGYDYVSRTHEYSRVIDQHIAAYEQVLAAR